MNFNPETSPHADRWAAARLSLRWMLKLFGGPEKIASLIKLVPARHEHILAWLKPIEKLLRRLILIEALSYQLNEAPLRPVVEQLQSEPVQRERKHIEIDPADPTKWPAHFKLIPQEKTSKAEAAPLKPGPNAKPSRFTPLPDAYPVAARFEAAIRVIENPVRYIARAARKLKTLMKLPKAITSATPLVTGNPVRFSLEGTDEYFAPFPFAVDTS